MMPALNIRKILLLSVVAIFVAGLVATTILVGRNQFFKPHASSQNIIIKDVNGNPLPEENGVPVTNSTSVQIQLIPPEVPAQ